jgi:hypothetical protein
MRLKMERKLQSSKDTQEIAKFSGFGQVPIISGNDEGVTAIARPHVVGARRQRAIGQSEIAPKQPLRTRSDHAA